MTAGTSTREALGTSTLARSRLAKVVAVATVPLLVAGALVTSTGSGMATDQWPWAYGQWFPSLRGGLLYEHGHRIVAALVGLMTLVLAAWTWRAEPKQHVRYLAGTALLLVVVQGLFGALTVKLSLPPAVSIVHAFLAQTFFCAVVALVSVTSPKWPRSRTVTSPGLRRLALAGLAVGFAQLLLGALLRHTGSGIVPHLAGAVLVIAVLWALVARTFREQGGNDALEGAAVTIVLVLLVQVFLGFGAYVTKYLSPQRPEPPTSAVLFTTAHVATGALLLAAVLVLAMRCARVVLPVPVADGGEDRARLAATATRS